MRVRSPTAVGLVVAGLVLLVYAVLTGGAVVAFAGEAFLVTVAWATTRLKPPPS